ncbi:MAG: transcriptional regulator [Candidatus Magasanikbacteria bacterium CG10_big_fil_rev_8_21_14_0_10_40_10]|uniref:Transcriptional regulator n=1 Tax=Candidatus Magasanikbacteria bacterium CG10_big_fil_rev_8_21_14_0_10_40_10 TaxID=1974648 RepID=A0A2M6W520_9BACT|nr:MAG: transcriptional regulator [Candidatus Magasanikbacteria bacterium CG10_big_fil_rev_8_21_14_0_10_40_10]
MDSWDKFKKELLKDKKFKKAYDELEPEFAIAEMLIRIRLEKGLSQADLAKKIGTKQPAIARLESGNYNPTLSLLNKVAKAMGAKLKINII